MDSWRYPDGFAHEYDDGEYHYFDIEGLFMEQMLGEESIIEYDGEFNRLYVLATVDDGEGNVMKVVACLRHLDDEWDYENDYPYLEKEGVKYYKGMSFMDIAKLFQLDLDMIPAPPSALASLSTGPRDQVRPPASLIIASPGLRLTITAGRLPPSIL